MLMVFHGWNAGMRCAVTSEALERDRCVEGIAWVWPRLQCEWSGARCTTDPEEIPF